MEPGKEKEADPDAESSLEKFAGRIEGGDVGLRSLMSNVAELILRQAQDDGIFMRWFFEEVFRRRILYGR